MNRVISGRSYEYTIKKALESQNYYVVRSAGSKGKVDLVGIHKLYPVLLIQVKSVVKLPINSFRQFEKDIVEMAQIESKHKSCMFVIIEKQTLNYVVLTFDNINDDGTLTYSISKNSYFGDLIKFRSKQK